MEQILSRLHFYHNLSVLCLLGAIISLAAAMVLFIRLRIWEILEILSGHRQRREIRRLERESYGDEVTELLRKDRQTEEREGVTK